MENSLQLVDFEQAKALKEFGFDWGVDNIFFYDLDNPTEQDKKENWVEDICASWQDWNKNTIGGEINMSRPTIALALKWLRDVKGLHVWCDFYEDTGNWFFGIMRITPPRPMDNHNGKFKTYDEAESAGLTKAISLIKTNTDGK